MKSAVKTSVGQSQKQNVRVSSFIVCDDVRREYNGKEILIGVYNNVIIFPALPSVMPNLVFRVALYANQMGVKDVKLTVVDETTKKVVMNSETQFEFKPQDSVYIFEWGLAGYPFSESTKLISSISVGGEKHGLPDVIIRLPGSEDERGQVRKTEK